jgi:hypothetical protein
LTLPSPDELPKFSKRAYVIGHILPFAVPVLLLTMIVILIAAGWPAVIAIPFLPFIAGLPAVALLLRRHGVRVTSWDDQYIELESARGPESVAWDDIDWFQKLWLVHKLEGGGKVWIAMLMRYRRASGGQSTVLFTVSGSASDSFVLEPLSPRRYTTVFDVRIPTKMR